MTTPQQQSLPGIPAPTPPDEKNADIEACLDPYLENKTERRRMGEQGRILKVALISKMQELGYTSYHYTDPLSGKRRQVVATPEVKLTTKGVPRASGHNDLYDDEADIAAQVGADELEDASDGKVEHRRVSRKSVQGEIDPFAGVRDRMDSPGGVQ